MGVFVFLLVLAIAIIVAIVFLNRYYRKATREVSLVRTGAGGRKVVLDGGAVALPFLHKVSEVNMRTTTLEIERLGPKSIITADRLRVDIGAEFHVRVEATDDAVATAAQALGQKTFRAGDLADTLEGKLVDAMLSVAARYTMDELQDDRAGYARQISEALRDNLARNGLLLESVSLTRIDQTPFHALDENNAFNALGMRRLAEVIATNKKERAAIEADADVSVRQTQLDAQKRRLSIGREEEEAMIAQQREIEVARAQSAAETAEAQSASEKRREAARIEREREVRLTEIEKDAELRRSALEAELSTETTKSQNAVTLAARRADEARAAAEAASARSEEARAAEGITTARETAQAERDKALALIRATEQVEVDDARVKSEADTVRAMAEAEAKATTERAAATRDKLIAEAEGRAKVIAAENAQSPELMAHKIDEARLRTLPGVVEKMMKPAEKIEGIRINHVTGFGPTSGGGGGGDGSTVNQVVDGMLSMALQMPAVRKLGEEVGLNIADGVAGLSASLEKPGGDMPDGDKDGADT